MVNSICKSDGKRRPAQQPFENLPSGCTDLHVSGIKGIASCALDDESNDVIACGSALGYIPKQRCAILEYYL